MDTNQEVSLLRHGDQVERDTWPKLKPHLSKYEVVWRILVVPLRNPASIYLRSGINADLETFAMNNYTAYINVARALEKIEGKADELKYSEEIWANLQRAVEVGLKAGDAFSRAYRECTRSDARIDTQQLDRAEESVKIYRNRLHDPISATLKDEHDIRLIPKRDKLEKYSRWTETMYDPDLSDFVTVESQLWEDFFKVCSSLQSLWTQIETLSVGLLQSAGYQKISATLTGSVPNYPIINADSSSGSTATGFISVSGSFSASDSFSIRHLKLPHK